MMKTLTYLAATLMCIALPAHSFTTLQPTLSLISAASSEAVMEALAKPRVVYAQVFTPKPQHQQHSIAAAIEWRLSESRKPVTANHDMTALRSSISDYIESNDLPDVWLLVFKKTKRRLNKEQLIGKSQPRDRLPTLEELVLFRERYVEQNKHPNCFTDMALVLDGLVLTGRRISELCRIKRKDVNVAKKTYTIYNLKNSKGKGYHGEAALIEGAWELFERRLAEIPDDPEARLFPFNSKTCSQRATKAKHYLQKRHPHLFHNLRMHDQRAYCFTELLKKHYTVTQVRKGVSLHSPRSKVLDEHYLRLTAEDLHKGPQGDRIVFTPEEKAADATWANV